MSLNLVKKSFYKFLNEGLSTTVTYDSTRSNLAEDNQIYLDSDLTAGVKTFVITAFGIPYQTTESLVGRTLVIGSEEDTITAWNNTTSTITIQNGFASDYTTTDEITINQTSLIYVKPMYSMANLRTRLISYEEQTRFNLYVKTKNDNNKDIIEGILQYIRDLCNSNQGRFTVYDTDGLTPLGTAQIKIPISENESIDIDQDMQLFIVSMLIAYHIKYI